MNTSVESLTHKMQRAAVGKMVDVVLSHADKDRQKTVGQLVDVAKQFYGSSFSAEAYEHARQTLTDPDSKWSKLINCVLDQTDPNVARTIALNLGYEAFFRGTKTIRENRVKYQCNIPWLILFDPTSACNMHCVGCWAGEYGNKNNLSFEDMDRIVTSDGFRRFVEVLENDPEGLADYLSDPVSMETVPVYEITSYGSSMAPYYIMLALFVGSLLTATMLHVNAPMPGLSRLRPWQRFFGRYQLFFLIGMIQALVTGLGCIYYIGIQCPYPGLFLLACCVCSLNFTMMNYALVYALDNIGMAASVIIMVIQVAGSGGVYPIDVLPGIFQTLYKFMPFHYGMDMLRETIAGRYENVYWKNLAVMAAMCVLFAVLGMVLYYPARPLNRLIARSKEKSGIM